MRTSAVDPLSLFFGGSAGLAAAKAKFGSDKSHNQTIDVVPADGEEGLVQRAPYGSIATIPHSYGGIFSAAGSGALSGVETNSLAGGWWDGTVARDNAGPVLELQGIHEDARQRLIQTVLATLKSAFKTYTPEEGLEAEAAQDLFAAVAESSTKEWLLGSRDMAAAVSAASGVTGVEEDSEEDAVDLEMVRRAGDLAADLIVMDEVELPGSKSALYLNLLSHMASLSRASEAALEAAEAEEAAPMKVADGEMAEAAIELASVAAQRADDGMSFSMAAVTVSVLEDAMLRVSEAIASAYLSRVREGASAPKITRAEKKLAAQKASGQRVSRVAQAQAVKARKTAMLAVTSASKVVRYALQLQPRLKSTRALEKFRNEVKLQGWMDKNYHDVVAMYEDWHSLMGVNEAGEIVQRRISICRHSELDQVKGMRLIMSMFLEFADVVVPVAQNMFGKFKQFSSWLLVTLIGRSLGLVYRGIRESMGGNKNDENRPRFA